MSSMISSRLCFGFVSFQVYDGPSEKSALIMEISGRKPLATVDSSSNQMFVRFVSDDQVSGPGFLVIYSSVP